MPIPNKQKGEKEQAFISRCMSVLKDENKPQDVKLAICYSKLKDAKKKKKAKGSNEEPTWDEVEKNGFVIFP